MRVPAWLSPRRRRAVSLLASAREAMSSMALDVLLDEHARLTPPGRWDCAEEIRCWRTLEDQIWVVRITAVLDLDTPVGGLVQGLPAVIVKGEDARERLSSVLRRALAKAADQRAERAASDLRN